MDRLKLMETYAAVVRLGSFTRAARELGITRAMVSKRIQDLEAVLDARLLNRDTHSQSPTATGADYYRSCLSILNDIRAVEDRLQSRKAALRGEIRLRTTKTFGETVVGPLVAEFCKQHPGITVNLTLADRDGRSNGQYLSSGGYDLSVQTLPAVDSTLVARSISGLPRVLVASPEYTATHGVPKNPADLAQHNCLDPSGTTASTWEFKGTGKKTRIRVSGSPQVNSSVVVRSAACTGVGIAILRQYLVQGDLKSGRLVRVLPEHTLDERNLYLVYQRDRRRPIRTKLLINHLSERIPAWLAGRRD